MPGPRSAGARLGRRGRDWDSGSLAVATRRDPVRATVYRPDIGGLLPLYVADRYDGIEARPFQDLSEAEVDRYVAGNVAAVREVAERVRPDVALANHLVMGPVVLARGSRRPACRTPSRSTAARSSTPSSRIRGSCRTRARASRARAHPRRLAPHRGEPVGRDGRPDGPRAHPPRPARVDVERFAPRAPGSAREGLERCGPASRRATRRPRPAARSTARPPRRRRRSPRSSRTTGSSCSSAS